MKSLAMFLVILLALPFLYHAGFRFNTTPSLPKGIYHIAPGTPARGDLVAFCLESPVWTPLAKERGYLGSGFCPSGLRPLLKHLAGLPGDTVEMTPDGILVTSATGAACRWPVATRHHDSRGRPLPPGALCSGAIPVGMALALASHPGSFDSRFFGLLPLATMTKVKPLFTF